MAQNNTKLDFLLLLESLLNHNNDDDDNSNNFFTLYCLLKCSGDFKVFIILWLLGDIDYENDEEPVRNLALFITGHPTICSEGMNKAMKIYSQGF
jgi:hypothetical protein